MPETPEVQPAAETASATTGLDPYQFLSAFPDAPTKAKIEAWKLSTCNGRVQVFSPDFSGKRAFILRGLSTREMEAAQGEVPSNTPADKLEGELQRATVAKAVLWTNVTKTSVLDTEALKMSGAGLTMSLYEIVCQLSDFLPPALIEKLSADL